MSRKYKFQPYSYSEERNAGNTPYTLAQNETLLECPYDQNHKVLDTRAAAHFLKCYGQHVKQRNVQNLPPQFKICDYSRLHHVRVELFKSHLETCPERYEICEEESEIDQSFAPKFHLEPDVRVNVKKPIKKEYNDNAWDFNAECPDDVGFESDGEKEVVEEGWEVRHPKRNYDFKLREKQMLRSRQPIGLTKSEKKERLDKIVENRNLNQKPEDGEWK